MKIAIIGAGWNGSHLAKVLQESGHEVTLFEKNPTIFSELSGKFGLRLHAGPHYPRSPATRKSCLRGLNKFRENYPEFVVEHEYSVYALGDKDANNQLPKVSPEAFNIVGQECMDYNPINPKDWGYTNLTTAMSVYEPSILVGEKLRNSFLGYLKKAEVELRCNFDVNKIEKKDGKFIINGNDSELFDKVINTTGYQSLLPNTDFPFEMEIVYQPCVVLMYEDTRSNSAPFSFTVMDGWFPCMMPYEEGTNPTNRKYMLYHSKWTIMGSFKTVKEANEVYDKIDDEFVKTQLKSLFEKDIKRFWPEFEERFTYDGFKKGVLAKIRSNREFRSTLTFASDDIINVVPGKINHIFDVEEEVKALIENQNLVIKGNYSYVKGGTLDSAMAEILEKPDDNAANTCSLQTYQELINETKGIPIIYPKAPHASFWSQSDSEDNEPCSSSPMSGVSPQYL